MAVAVGLQVPEQWSAIRTSPLLTTFARSMPFQAWEACAAAIAAASKYCHRP